MTEFADLGAGLAGLLIAVSFGPQRGWANTSTLAFLVGGLVLPAEETGGAVALPERWLRRRLPVGHGRRRGQRLLGGSRAFR